jgi:hypothetical protein
LRAALVASCFLGALPPVDLRAVCLVRAMLLSAGGEGRGGEGGGGQSGREGGGEEACGRGGCWGCAGWAAVGAGGGVGGRTSVGGPGGGREARGGRAPAVPGQRGGWGGEEGCEGCRGGCLSPQSAPTTGDRAGYRGGSSARHGEQGATSHRSRRWVGGGAGRWRAARIAAGAKDAVL